MRILILIIFSLFALQLQAKKPVLDPSVLAPTHGYAFVYYPKGTLGDLAVESEKDGKQHGKPGKTHCRLCPGTTLLTNRGNLRF